MVTATPELEQSFGSAAGAADMLRAWARSWRPLPRTPLAEWCERELRLPAETSATPGRFDLGLHGYPYLRGILEAAEDPRVETIVIMASTQVGKTTLLLALLLALAANDPAPALIATPDRISMWKLRDKFYRFAEESAVTRRWLLPRSLRNDKMIDLGRALCYLGYAGSPQTLSGESCRVVLCTEVSRWKKKQREGAPTALAKRRTDAFFRKLHIFEGTPTDETCEINALYQTSDKRRLFVPCPVCGAYQELRFYTHQEGPNAGRGGIVGITTDEGRYVSPETARKSAYYTCEAKGCRIDNIHKSEMVYRGVWCPMGQTVRKDGRLEGKPERGPSVAGFHLWRSYSEASSFGEIAAEYLDARDDPELMQSFRNNVLAKIWRRIRSAPKWQRVGARLAAAHPRGRVPASACFLTAGIDVQEHYVTYVVRAWGEGRTSWLVDWGRVDEKKTELAEPIIDSDLDLLEELVFNRRFPWASDDPLGRRELRPALSAIDIGYARRKRAVANLVRRMRAGDTRERVRAVAGDTRVNADDLFQIGGAEKSAQDGEKIATGVRRWNVNVNVYKDDIYERFDAAIDQPGAFFFCAGVLENGEEYLRQLCNEGKQITRNKAGQQVISYQITDHRLGNHFLDDEVYAAAAADMVVERDWSNLKARVAASAARRRRPGTAPAPGAQRPGSTGPAQPYRD